MTEAGDQMSEAQEEPNQILGFPDQNSPHIDAERATVERSKEECCQEQQTLQAESQQTTLPQDHHHHQT